MSMPWQSGDLCHYKERRHLVLLLAAQAMPGKKFSKYETVPPTPKSWSALPLFYCLTLSFVGFKKWGRYHASLLHRVMLCPLWAEVWVESLEQFCGWITFGSVECHVTIMSCLSVSLCVTPTWVYGLAASSALLIPVPGLDYTSTVECTLITYHAVSIHHLTSVCLLTSERLMGWKKISYRVTISQTVSFFFFFCNFTTTAFPIFLFLFKDVSSSVAWVQRAF